MKIVTFGCPVWHQACVHTFFGDVCVPYFTLDWCDHPFYEGGLFDWSAGSYTLPIFDNLCIARNTPPQTPGLPGNIVLAQTLNDLSVSWSPCSTSRDPCLRCQEA